MAGSCEIAEIGQPAILSRLCPVASAFDAIIRVMSSLQTLRDAQRLTRFVLVWFALFIGVAVASPLVQPRSLQMVCSAMGGMKMVLDDASDTPVVSGGMACPLCTQITAPGTPVALSLEVANHLAHALRPIPSAHIAWLSGSPLPPRGPPAFS